jgi:hypothetical protein
MIVRELPTVVDTATRTVTVRLCRWNDPQPVIDPDGQTYREQYDRGSVRLATDVHVVDRHSGALIGRARPDTLTDDGDGPVVELTIARTAAGNDVLAQLDAGVIRAVSMELEAGRSTTHGDLVTRHAVTVHGVAFAFRPQLSAPVLSVRGDHETETIMPTDTEPIVTPAEPDTPAAPVVQMVDAVTLDRAVDELRRELVTRDAPAGPSGHPLGRFRSLDELVTASWSDPTVPVLLARALVDQITTNNPGVIPPGWLSTVFGIVDRGRPAVTAFGVRAAPSEGMDVNWPYFDGDLMALVAQQVTEKTPITSVRVDLKRGTEELLTYAGGSDISYQLIRRSSPSYREAYMRIMFAAYAAVTDNAAADAAAAGATASAATWDATAAGADAGLATALFTASTEVAAATGQPASFALASTDVFIAAGGQLIPPQYGTSNQSGTASAATLAVNVSGLPVIHDANLAAGTLIASNGEAAGWFEDGPFTVTAEDVEKLGQNVAVWGMGAFGLITPAGVRKIATTLTTLPLSTKSK